jgi:hypothetical protein
MGVNGVDDGGDGVNGAVPFFGAASVPGMPGKLGILGSFDKMSLTGDFAVFAWPGKPGNAGKVACMLLVPWLIIDSTLALKSSAMLMSVRNGSSVAATVIT